MPLNTFDSTCVKNLSLTSHDLYDIQQKIYGSLIDRPNFDEKWILSRALSIDNKDFLKQFMEKRIAFHGRRVHFTQSEVRYGFLATIKESMVHKVADEGLQVRLCPYNFFGYNISGIHISQNADLCLNEACKKIGPGEEIILIVFKYMVGKSKTVSMYDPNILLAPTPNYDSHICQEPPSPNETIRNQYIKSMVYLYEFENENYDPVSRPRHCCPVAALIFKQKNHSDVIDLTDHTLMPLSEPIREESPVPFYKPNPQTQWAREFILQTSQASETNDNNQSDDFQILSVSEKNGGYNKLDSPIEETVKRWEPIGQEFQNRKYKDSRDEPVRERSRPRYDMNANVTRNKERDRSFDRLNQWKTRSNGESFGIMDYHRRDKQANKLGYSENDDYAEDTGYYDNDDYDDVDNNDYKDGVGYGGISGYGNNVGLKDGGYPEELGYASNMDYNSPLPYPKNAGYYQSANYNNVDICQDKFGDDSENIGYFNSVGYQDNEEVYSEKWNQPNNVIKPKSFGFSTKNGDYSKGSNNWNLINNFGEQSERGGKVDDNNPAGMYGPMTKKMSSRNWFR